MKNWLGVTLAFSAGFSLWFRARLWACCGQVLEDRLSALFTSQVHDFIQPPWKLLFMRLRQANGINVGGWWVVGGWFGGWVVGWLVGGPWKLSRLSLPRIIIPDCIYLPSSSLAGKFINNAYMSPSLFTQNALKSNNFPVFLSNFHLFHGSTSSFSVFFSFLNINTHFVRRLWGEVFRGRDAPRNVESNFLKSSWWSVCRSWLLLLLLLLLFQFLLFVEQQQP